ncbi:hypothetical protein HY995_04905 [Candidatus Micrarchaeota archaeon]|nr:hypothetical protein [Candidatus Micrarchaeota archaeon]
MTGSLAWLYILLAALAYALFTVTLNKAMGIRDRQKFLQREVNAYQRELGEIAKTNDEKRLEILKTREKDVQGYMFEMMLLPWKSFIFIIPVFFLLIGTNGFLGLHFSGLLNGWFSDFVTTLPIGLHLNEIRSLRILSPSVYGPRGFFIVCVIFAGLLIEAVFSRVEKRLEAAIGSAKSAIAGKKESASPPAA